MESIAFVAILVVGFFIRVELETQKSKKRLADVIGALKMLGFNLKAMPSAQARLVRRVLMNNVLENRENFNVYEAAVKGFLATSIKPSTPNYVFCSTSDRATLARSVVVLETWSCEKKITMRLRSLAIGTLSEHLFGNESSALQDPVAADALYIVSRLKKSAHLAEFNKKLVA